MASEMDQALDLLLSETDKTYAKFSSASKSQSPSSGMGASGEKKGKGSSSRSRLMDDTAASASFKGTALNGKSMLETATADRKMAYVMKRMEQLEREVKRLQSDKDEQEELRERCHKLESQMKAFKISESKVHGVTNDMITTMKQQLTILLRKDELIAQADHNFPPRPPGESQAHVDAEAVAAKVYEVVQKDVEHRMAEVLSTCMKEQTVFLNQWSDGRVTGLEARLTSTEESMDRCTRDTDAVRTAVRTVRHELAAEMRAENEALIELMGHKVNDAIHGKGGGRGQEQRQSRVTASQALNDSRFESMREEYMRGLESQSEESAEALSRLAVEVRQIGDMHSHLEMAVARVGAQAEDALASAHAHSTEAASRLGGSSAATRPLHQQQQQQQQSPGRDRESDFIARQDALKVESALKSLQRNLVSVQSDVESAHISIGRHEERMRALSTVVDELRLDSRVKLTNLVESDAKMRLKVTELERSHEDVSNTRGAVEAVLREVDARSHSDASWAYQFKQAAKALDKRVGALEVDRGMPVGNTNSSPMRSSPHRPGTNERIAALERRVDDIGAANMSLTELNDKIALAGPALTELCEASVARIQDAIVADGTGGRLGPIEDRLEFIWRHGGFAEMHTELLNGGDGDGAEKEPVDVLREGVVVGPSTLKFRDDDVAASRSKFHISNATERVVAYKTRVSVQHVFTVRPTEGFLRPGEVRSVDIVMRPGRQRSSDVDLSKSRFAVELLFPSTGDLAADVNPKALWAAVGQGAMEAVVLRKEVLCEIIGRAQTSPQLDGSQGTGSRVDCDSLDGRGNDVDAGAGAGVGAYVDYGDDDDDDDDDAETMPSLDSMSLARRIQEVEERRVQHRDFFRANFI